MYDRDKLIVTATLGDLEDLLVNVLTRVSANNTDSHVALGEKKETIVRGIDGICQALGVGKTKAQEIKNTGVLKEAIDEVSPRIFYVHTEKAKELYYQQKIV